MASGPESGPYGPPEALLPVVGTHRDFGGVRPFCGVLDVPAHCAPTGFAWAEELLSDPDLVAGDGAAARLISYIRADETPHVDYLRTALAELRDRTVVGDSGRRHAGSDLVGGIWDRALAQSLGINRLMGLDNTWNEVAHAVGDRPGAADLLARFDELGSVHRRADGTWQEAGEAA